MEIVKFGNEDVIATSNFILHVEGAGTGSPSFTMNGVSFTGYDNADGMKSMLQAAGVNWTDLGQRSFVNVAFDTDKDGHLTNGEYYFQYTNGNGFMKQPNLSCTHEELSSLNGDWLYVGYDGHDKRDTYQKDTWVAFLFQRIAN